MEIRGGGSWVWVVVSEDVGSFEAVLEHEGFVVEDVGGGAFGDDLAVIDGDDAWAEIDDEFHVVSGDNLCDGQLAQQCSECASAAWIESVSRLIEQQDLRIHGQHGGQRHEALFPAGEAVCDCLLEAGKSDAGHGFPGDCVGLGGGLAEVKRTEGDFFVDSGAEELVVRFLEKESDAGAGIREILVGGAGVAEDLDGPRGRLEQPGHQMEDRGFP